MHGPFQFALYPLSNPAVVLAGVGVLCRRARESSFLRDIVVVNCRDRNVLAEGMSVTASAQLWMWVVSLRRLELRLDRPYAALAVDIEGGSWEVDITGGDIHHGWLPSRE